MHCSNLEKGFGLVIDNRFSTNHGTPLVNQGRAAAAWFFAFGAKGNAMLRKMFDVLVAEFGRAGYALSLQWCILEPVSTLDEWDNGAHLDSDAPAAL